MIKAKKITYKVFLFERVKKKVKFLDTETYPLQIRLTAGTRTLYLKSYFFSILQQNRYIQEIKNAEKKISIDDVIVFEEELMNHLLAREEHAAALEPLREQYSVLSRDILLELDIRFKDFLVDFFSSEQLPAYAIFIRNDRDEHTSEFILHNLEKSLHPEVYSKLLRTAVEKAPPYIPLMAFYREKLKTVLPVLPVYHWQSDNISTAFTNFIEEVYPEYRSHYPAASVNRLMGLDA